ncbi:SH3 domain-containing protein [Aminobacter sp. AP02]|uniref:SH3 domain-containing protein n=1 Tax=Aminobacter sp. AP02 TaxID=2135737 RepID=UPI000D6C5750|nr:SH3 domain-containing protein [Aminobacter sp. AP02]PWK65940.1 SH3 domain-containing protein [Aminobacter sp. AP02]
MSGFALPKLRWLVLGALAAGGWAMTQEMPSKARLEDRPSKTLSRPKAETTPRSEATVTRPKVNLAPRPQTEVVRPKLDVEPSKAAATPKPKAEVAPQKIAMATRPKTDSTPRNPRDVVETASIKRPPTPLPRPKPAAKQTSAKPESDSATTLNVLYTSTSVYLRQRPNVSAPVTSSLKQGESVRVFARDGKWTLVSASGRKGWVHGDMLRPADPAAPRPKQTLARPAKAGAPG